MLDSSQVGFQVNLKSCGGGDEETRLVVPKSWDCGLVFYDIEIDRSSVVS